MSYRKDTKFFVGRKNLSLFFDSFAADKICYSLGIGFHSSQDRFIDLSQ